jgi:DNA invertase Pin-like site-specific DNA recombinase
MKAAIYARVSTTNGQTPKNQLLRLREVAAKAGWTVAEEFVDRGISGAKGRDKRPAFDRLCKAITRRDVDVVMAWSVDRLGRSLQDLVGFLSDLEAVGVHLYLDRQGVDTTTLGGKALFQMMGVFAEFERAMIQERINAGIARARKHGTKSGRPIGRPRIPEKTLAAIHAARAEGKGIKRIARDLGVGVGTVQKAVHAE